MSGTNTSGNPKGPNALDKAFDRLFVYFGASTNLERRLLVLVLAVLVGYVERLVYLSWGQHKFMFDRSGHLVTQDFLAFWTAGRAAISGNAALTYRPEWMHAAETAFAGREAHLSWHYPPAFFLALAPLALLPYSISFLAFATSSAAVYADLAVRISARRAAALLALAVPFTYINFFKGQNGFLTAALLGFGLLQLEKRPILAGIFLGAASYKPQFFILVPFALAAGGYWRSLASALGVAILSNLVAAWLFGFGTIGAFLHQLAAYASTMSEPWYTYSYQTFFAAIRGIGVPLKLALALQTFWMGACAIVVALFWRGQAPTPLKTALLLAATPVAPQYVFIYDLPILSLAVAFLYRHRPFDRTELIWLSVAMVCVVISGYLMTPVALFSGIVIAALTIRRTPMYRHLRTGPPSEPHLAPSRD